MKTLNALISITRRFRGIDERLQMQTVETFLLIARYPAISVSQLVEATGLSQASVSRNCTALSDINRAGERGYNLIERCPDPEEPRRFIFFLSAHGRQMIREIASEAFADFGLTDKDLPLVPEWRALPRTERKYPQL